MARSFGTNAARNSYEKHLVRTSTRIGGTVDAIFAKGGDALVGWLVAETPEGSTVAETLAAIALDAMLDEQDT
jgi:hypothetical protein